MDEVFARLVEAAKKNKGCDGNSAIATLLNESPQVITNWTKRGVPRGKVAGIASAVGVTTDWLLTGIGDMPNLPGPMSPQEKIMLELFRELPEDQRSDLVRSLETQKQQNDKFWEQMSKVKAKKAQ